MVNRVVTVRILNDEVEVVDLLVGDDLGLAQHHDLPGGPGRGALDDILEP